MFGIGRKTEDRKVGARFIARSGGVSRGRDESCPYICLVQSREVPGFGDQNWRIYLLNTLSRMCIHDRAVA
jgi:hypothetical protein